MDYKELLDYLDLEDGSKFEYFEAIADLIESEEYIEQEAMFMLFEEADKEMVKELLEDYFEDTLEGLGDNSGEIYSLLHQIKICLTGLVSQAEDESSLRMFTNEFYKFQTWFSHDSEVELTPISGVSAIYQNVRDAITSIRLENLGGEKYRYNFENALDYELDSYVMSFSDLIDRAEEDNQQEN